MRIARSVASLLLLSIVLTSGPAVAKRGWLTKARAKLARTLRLTRAKLGRAPRVHQPPRRQQAAKRAGRPDLVVISDLHLGEGKIDGALSKREHFSAEHQSQFDRLVKHLLSRQGRAKRKMKVVLAGDIFDFLLVSKPPAGKRWSAEEALTATPSERLASEKMQRIAEHHADFFSTLRRVREAGHDIVVLAGNHDQEILFPNVKSQLYQLTKTKKKSAGSFAVEPWFHLHGDALVEHGHRYDPVNNIGWMLHPFSTDGKEPTLRAAAGSTFVAKMVTGLRGKLPRNFRPKNAGDVFHFLRWLPPSLRKWLAMVARFADSTGPLSPEAERILVERHHHTLEKIASTPEMLTMINETRSRQGEPPINQQALRALLHQFDRQQARPILHRKVRPIEKRTKLGKILAAFSPREWLAWIRPRSSSRLRWGQQFALRQLANVVVGGHTHHKHHFVLTDKAGHRQHLANSGTWAGDHHYPMTFVEVRQDENKESHVRLRKWDAERGLAVTVPATHLEPGKIPSSRQVH